MACAVITFIPHWLNTKKYLKKKKKACLSGTALQEG